MSEISSDIDNHLNASADASDNTETEADYLWDQIDAEKAEEESFIAADTADSNDAADSPEPAALFEPETQSPSQNGHKSSALNDYETQQNEKEADRKLKADSLKIAASLGNFGLFLVLAVLFGYFIGHALDGFFGTKPILTIFWVCCGVAAAVRELVKNIKAAGKLSEDKNTTHQG